MKNIQGFIAVIIAYSFLMVNCSNVLAVHENVPTHGQVRVIIESGGEEARTVYPINPGFIYTLSFTREGKAPVVKQNAGTSMTVDLEIGTWTLIVTGEKDGIIVAESDGIAVQVVTEETTPVTAVIHPKTGNDMPDGIFHYEIEFDNTLKDTSTVLSMTPLNVGGIAPEPITGLTEEGTGDISLKPGYYRLKVTAQKGMQIAVKGELVHIYSNTTSIKKYTFNTEDFAEGVYLAGTVDNSQHPDYVPVKIFAYSDSAGTHEIGNSLVSIGDLFWSMLIPAEYEIIYFKIELHKTSHAFFSRIIEQPITMAGNSTLTLRVESYEITFADITHGIITIAESITEAFEGSEITLENPNNEYWKGKYNDGISDHDITGTGFIMPAADITISLTVLQFITVTTPPLKTVYGMGEELNIDGLTVKGTYTDNTLELIPVTKELLSGFNSIIAGDQTVTIAIAGKTTTFMVTVQGNRIITINLDDPVNGLPEQVNLSKTGYGIEKTVSLSITGTYAGYAWYVNGSGSPVSTTSWCFLDAALYPLGNNNLRVEVQNTNGVYYAEEITFTISVSGQSLSITETVKEFIFEDDREFNSCHASTILLLENGDILAAWFGGTREGAADVAIWMSRRTAEGWQKPWKIADNSGLANWNPVLFRSPGGRIFLYYKEGETSNNWHTMVKHSDDNGLNFSEAKELIPGDIGGRGPVKNKPIILMNGDIVAPVSVQEPYWDCFIDISTDGGETWEASPFIPIQRISDTEDLESDIRNCYGKGIIQPTLWEYEPGHIHALMRSTSSAIFRSDSIDNGRTWSDAYRTGLPNNNCGIDLIKLPNGGLILAYNPVESPVTSGRRTPLILSYSADNGQTWNQIFTLEDEAGEYSYPAIIADGDEIMITYTWKRQRIAFWTLRYQG
jgi:predicted neuraminidase